jgi:hypothetical protein
MSHGRSHTRAKVRLGRTILTLAGDGEDRQGHPDQDADDADDDHQLHEREPSLVARAHPANSWVHLFALSTCPSVAERIGLNVEGGGSRAAPFWVALIRLPLR